MQGIDGVTQSSGIGGVRPQVADQAGPARQLRKVPGQVLDRAVVRDGQALERLCDGLLGAFGQGADLGGEVTNAEELPGPVARRQHAPRLIEPVLASRHRPARHPLVDERRDPPGHLPVDGLDERLPGERLQPVADRARRRECDGRSVDRVGRRWQRVGTRRIDGARGRVPARLPEGAHVAFFGDPTPIGDFQGETIEQPLAGRGGQVGCGLRQRPAGADRPGEQQRLERRESEEQLRPPDLGGFDAAAPGDDRRESVGGRAEAPQGGRDGVACDPAIGGEAAVFSVRQIALAADQALPFPHRLIEGQVFQPEDRAVVREPLQRPELGNRLACRLDQAAHALDVGRRRRVAGVVGGSQHSAHDRPVPGAPATARRPACRAAVGWADSGWCRSRPVMTSSDPASRNSFSISCSFSITV